MSTQKQTRLPNIMRNPLLAEQIAAELEEWSEVLEKQAAEEGRSERIKPRLRVLKAGVREIRGNAEARIGDQL